MDVVYIVGKGSNWNDNELKYSLRSVQKFLSGGSGRVYIVGHRPAFLNDNIIHLSMGDFNPKNKEKNIFQKVWLACMKEEISKNFLCFHDDHFLIRPVLADRLPYYSNGETLVQYMQRKKSNDPYRIAIANTYTVLKNLGKPIKNFNVHGPLIYDKEKFIQSVGSFDWSYMCGFIIKCLYCNYFDVKHEILSDLKIKTRLTVDQLKEVVNGRPYFSIADTAIGSELETFLENLFPEKSCWEK